MRRAMMHLGCWAAALWGPVRIPAAMRSNPIPAIQVASGLAAALIAVAIAMVLVDARVGETVSALPSWAIAGFEDITDFGRSGWFLWPIGLALLALAALTRPALGRVTNLVAAAVAVRLGFVFLAIAIPGLAVSIVKRLIGRVRPSAFGPFHYIPLSWRPDYASMPSGHSAAAFAAAVAIGAVWPQARVPMWAYAAVIAVSRVAVSAHYPSDVIAGAVIGASSALMVRRWFARRRIGFVLRPDGAVHAMPGPSRRRLWRVVARLIAPDRTTPP